MLSDKNIKVEEKKPVFSQGQGKRLGNRSQSFRPFVESFWFMLISIYKIPEFIAEVSSKTSHFGGIKLVEDGNHCEFLLIHAFLDLYQLVQTPFRLGVSLRKDNQRNFRLKVGRKFASKLTKKKGCQNK